MNKKFTPVTDPQEVEELETFDGDLGKPVPFKPNGHLWIETDELAAWRHERTSRHE